jgi:hypothetical protein
MLLRETVASHDRIVYIRDVLTRADNPLLTSLIMIDQAIPCILHLENRVNEKVFYTLLAEGMDRYREGPQHSQKRKQFIEAIAGVMNSRVLVKFGGAPAQWEFPLSKDE